ncbi:NlpC/P60 family protein [Agromyces intestinalis]|nr:C40 family peptidase [Agromyces intestinalis]
MTEPNRTRPVSRVKPATVFSTVAIGAVTASVAVVGGAGPAVADDYPSWAEIEQAKQNEQTKQAEIARLGELLAGLQQQADAAIQASQIADEAWRNAVIARDAQVERERVLAKRAGEAEAVAEISRMRAGLLAAHLARSAGTDLGAELAFSGDPEELLQQLGMAAQLGSRSQTISEQATADRNSAESLRRQADRAASERKRLAAAAEQRATEARAAADAAAAAVAEAARRSTELYAQLASLKDTTADLERQRAEGIAREQAEAAAAAAAAEAAAAAAAAEQAANPPTSGGASGPAPAPDPAPAPPDGSAVEAAIAYASAQLGEPYVLGGAGPDVWDCSGLTMQAYGSAGIWIGPHSATAQYRTLAGQGKAVPLGQIQRGDLLFWGGGGDYYHVAIYLGGGRILEAPREGVPVRDYFIWGSPAAAARPAA